MTFSKTSIPKEEVKIDLHCASTGIEKELSSTFSKSQITVRSDAKWKLLVDTPTSWVWSKLSDVDTDNVIVATSNPCPEYLLDLRDRGASVIPFIFPIAVMTQEIRSLIRGNSLIIPHDTSLSKAERQTLFLSAIGLSRKRAAKERGVSPETIKSTLRPVFLKLNLTSHNDLVNYYFGLWHNIIDWEPPRHVKKNYTHKG